MKPCILDFASAHPDMLKEWDYENNEKSPSEYSALSVKDVLWICPKGHHYHCSINRRVQRGHGCPYCYGKRLLAGYNDLQTRNPDLAKEWNQAKNGDLTPQDVMLTTNKKAWWKCRRCGNEWEALISNRGRGVGCKKCGYKKAAQSRQRRIIQGKGSFADLHPELLEDWDYEKNNPTVYPTDITTNANIRVHWKCHLCGHEWICTVNSRSNGSQCIKCSYKRRQIPNKKK